MGVIGRFNRPSAPAKFNPLSADEIMKVPMMKGALEQKQLEDIETARLAMLNAKVAPADMERVREEQQRLSEGFDNLTARIAKNGVGYRTTDEVNNYMKEYNTATSAAGTIGGAVRFNESREKERKFAKEYAIKQGYNMGEWQQLERDWDTQQTAFGDDGMVQEYNALALPNRIQASDTLEDELKKIGFHTNIDDVTGTKYKDNEKNIQAAIDLVVQRYENDPTYRQLMNLQGKSLEDIKMELRKKGNILLENSITPGAKVTTTTKPGKDEETDNLFSEDMFTWTETPMRDVGRDVSRGALERNKLNFDSGKITYEKYMQNENFIKRSRELYDETKSAQALNKLKIKLNEDLKKGTIKEFESTPRFDTLAEANEELAKLKRQNEVALKNPPSTVWGNSTNDTALKRSGILNELKPIQDENGKWYIPDPNDPTVQELVRVKDSYNTGLIKFAGEGNAHTAGNAWELDYTAIETGSMKQGNWMKKANMYSTKVIKNLDPSMKVQKVTISNKDSDDNWKTDDPIIGAEAAALKGDLINVANSGGKIESVKYVPRTAYSGPRIIYKIHQGKKLYEVEAEFDTTGMDPKLIKELPFWKATTSGLEGNARGKQIAKSFVNSERFKNVGIKYLSENEKPVFSDLESKILDATRNAPLNGESGLGKKYDSKSQAKEVQIVNTKNGFQILGKYKLLDNNKDGEPFIPFDKGMAYQELTVGKNFGGSYFDKYYNGDMELEEFTKKFISDLAKSNNDIAKEISKKLLVGATDTMTQEQKMEIILKNAAVMFSMEELNKPLYFKTPAEALNYTIRYD